MLPKKEQNSKWLLYFEQQAEKAWEIWNLDSKIQ